MSDLHLWLSNSSELVPSLQRVPLTFSELLDRDEKPQSLVSRLSTLGRQGILRLSALDSGRQNLATFIPDSPYYRFEIHSVRTEQAFLLSRFAFVRRYKGVLRIESPRSYGYVVVEKPEALALLHNLREAFNSGAPLTSLLRTAGLIVSPGEEEKDSLRYWEFHDFLFHVRSRLGRHRDCYGYANRSVREQPAALKESRDSIPLRRPEIDGSDPFQRLLDQRRSCRSYGHRPITIDQLSEFLYRAARVKKVEHRTWGNVECEIAKRPYPSGGVLYELELYVAGLRCEGLVPGLYRYDSLQHGLERQGASSTEWRSLIEHAGRVTRIDHPQVLIILAARLPRIAWRYRSIAYSLVLKHVGVVMQTMYLLATSMNLAPCAVGGGDMEAFARASGLDPGEESSVGEFMLGSSTEE